MTLKNGFGESSLFFYLPMDEKIKSWTKTEKSKDYCKADSEQLVVFS